MNKRGFVSAFIIIGLLLIFLTAFLIRMYYSGLGNEAESAALFTQTKDSLKTYVEGCVDYTVMDLRDKLWVVNDPKLVKDYLDEHYMECIDDFSSFRKKAYDIEYSGPEMTAEIINRNLFVDMTFPIELSKADQRTTFEEFQYKKTDYAKEEIPEGYEMIYRNIIYREDDLITEDGIPVHYYVVKIALEDPGTSFIVTPHQTGLQPVIDFQQQHNVQIAINGDQWPWPSDTPYRSNDQVAGLAASLGDVYAPRPEDSGEVAIFISEDNEVSIGRKPNVIYNAISGSTTLVVNGDLNAKLNKGHPDHKAGYETRRPRTAIGLDEINNHLIFVISVGDTGDMPGLNFRELAYILLEHDATHAINMDGGGSTSLVIENMDGIVYTAEGAGGRPVANHLGVYGTPYVTTG